VESDESRISIVPTSCAKEFDVHSIVEKA